MTELCDPTIIVTCGHEGSSAFTQILHELGVFLGKPSNLASNSRKQYFEYTPFQELNREMLGAKAYPYDHFELEDRFKQILTYFLDKDFHDTARKAIIHSMLNDGLKHGMQWALKDPRTCITFPVWLKIFPDAKFIFLDRSQQDTLIGWNTKGDDGYFPTKKHWYSNFAMVKDETKKIVIHYDELSYEFEKTVKFLCSWFNVKKPIPLIMKELSKLWVPKYNGVIGKPTEKPDRFKIGNIAFNEDRDAFPKP